MAEHQQNTSDGLADLALTDPKRAAATASEILDSSPPDSQAIPALRARGLARRQLGDLDAAAADLTDALTRAESLGDDELWASAGISLAGVRVFQGKVEAAKELLHACIARAQGEAHVEAIYQLGTTHAQAGDLDSAVAHYARALPMILELDRPTWAGNLLGNRGVMNIYRGQYDDALEDLDAAIKLHADEGPSMFALHRDNKAYALQLRGDLTDAVDLYEANDQFKRENDLPPLANARRCTAYVAAGMFEEALELAHEMHSYHQRHNTVLDAIEALLPGAEAALALGKPDVADHLAEAAIAIDGENSFPLLTARARLTLIESRRLQQTVDEEDGRRAEQLAGESLASDAAVGLRALLLAAALALDFEKPEEAADLLERAAPVVARAPGHLGIEHATISARAATDAPDVLTEVAVGLARYDELMANVETYNIRYQAARHATQLSRLGLEALLPAHPAEAVELIEQTRAGALSLGGRSLEPAIPHTDASAEISHLIWEEHQRRLVALVQVDGAWSVHDCGSLADVSTLVDRHRFIHRQLARRRNLGPDVAASLSQDAADVRYALAHRLLPPVTLADRVIVNPPAHLSGVVWGELPGLRERSFSVSPSRAIASRTLPPRIDSVAVLGDDSLAHAAREVSQVAEIWAVEGHLDPTEAVLPDLVGIDLLHVASHFEASQANPLLSGLPLGQLQLRGHEYLQLSPPPRIAVLAACWSGRGDAIAGAEVGFASAALAAGTAAVVVTDATIEDSPAVVELSLTLHRRLHRGERIADALRDIRTGPADSAASADRTVADSFSVLGTGW